MRKLQKSLMFFLFVCLLCLSLPATTALANPDDPKLTYNKMIYEKRGDHIAIVDCEWDIAGDVVIPATIDGLPVTEIRDNAFFCEYNITSIHIPATVTSLGSEGSFVECPKLAKVTIDEDNPNYRILGEAIFTKDGKTLYFCPPLARNPYIPNGVTKIQTRAFYGSKTLFDAYIPDSVTEIGALAFGSCSELLSATVPEGITVLYQNTFSLCIKMTEVTLPASLKQIEHSVFADCIKLTDVYYNGTESDWRKIDIHYHPTSPDIYSNAALRKATIHSAASDIALDLSYLAGGQDSSVFFGKFPQSDATGATKDPIKWRTLANSNGKLFLLSDQNLYGSEYVPNCSVPFTWAGSTLRSWLGGAFLTSAFSAGEQGAIASTELANADNVVTAPVSGVGTTDKIFALSIADANNSDYFPSRNSRAAITTAYAAKCFAGSDDTGKPRDWWLRSRGSSVDMTALVSSTGLVDDTGFWANNIRAVRPAFNLDLTPVLFASAVGKSYTVGTLTAPGMNAANEWRLTLRDSSRSGFSASCDGTVSLGSSVSIRYSNAKTGSNEFISVMLLNSKSGLLAYGRIAQNSAAGTATLSLPVDLTPGNYTLKVFNEQYNGDKTTGYASDFVNLSLTVTSAHTHTYAEAWSTDGSSHWHECACGAKADAAAHTPTPVAAVESTCSVPGKTAGSRCAVCNYVITAQTTAPLKDHTLTEAWQTDAAAHWRLCTICNETLLRASHTWNDGAVTTQPTTDAAGVKTYSCTVCGQTKTEAIPALAPPPQPPAPAAPPAPILQKPAPTPTPLPFKDVPKDAWYYDAVQTAYQRGLMPGASENSFRPEAAVSRASLLSILYKLENPSAAEERAESGAVTWAAEHGIVLGSGNGGFQPDAAISREQLAIILYRYARTKGRDVTQTTNLSAFADAHQISDYAREAMAWASATGLFKGTGQNKLSPNAAASGAQIATVLIRFLAL